MKYASREKTVTVRLIEFHGDKCYVQSSEYDITFTLETMFDDADNIDEAQLKQDISFSKIIFFLAEIINDSLVFGAESNTELFNKFHGWHGNNIIVLPEVAPHYLIAALHAKLNAIAEDMTFIHKIRLYDRVDQVTYELYMTDDDEYDELPDCDKWLGGSSLSYWSGCWWHRNDINTIDRVAETQEEHNIWLQMKQEHNIDELNTYPFKEIEKEFYDTVDNVCEGEVIAVDFKHTNPNEKRTIWKPVIVE